MLRTIAATLRDRGEDALLGGMLKEAATERVFGFEILPAPFVVAHLQLGLFLQAEGVPLEGKKERAGVYLTNALTGWEPPKGPKQKFLYPEMQEEHDKADHLKRGTEILVVLGNPPYNGFAGVAVEEERDLSDAYRRGAGGLKPQGQGLNDLYIRFFRMAERCIADKPPRHGVVCFISNYSWLDGLSFPVMRQRYLDAFDAVWIDCLNGDKYKTGKQTPDGQPDPSVFSTEHNREGIQVGTAVALLVRKGDHYGPAAVRFRHLWGQRKRADLLESLDGFGPLLYETVMPARCWGCRFSQWRQHRNTSIWPLLTELFPVSFPGVKTSRDDFLVDIDRQQLMQRMEMYFDHNVSNEEMRAVAPRVITNATRFEAVPVRAELQKRGILPDNFVRYAYRPFDGRWLYWEPLTKLLDEKRSEFFTQVFAPNCDSSWTTGAQNRKDVIEPAVPTARLVDQHHGAAVRPLHPLDICDMEEGRDRL